MPNADGVSNFGFLPIIKRLPLLQKISGGAIVAVNAAPFQDAAYSHHVILVFVLSDSSSPQSSPEAPFCKSFGGRTVGIGGANKNVYDCATVLWHVGLILTQPNVFLPKDPAACANRELYGI